MTFLFISMQANVTKNVQTSTQRAIGAPMHRLVTCAGAGAAVWCMHSDESDSGDDAWAAEQEKMVRAASVQGSAVVALSPGCRAVEGVEPVSSLASRIVSS